MPRKPDNERRDIDSLQTAIITRAAQLGFSEQQLAEAAEITVNHVHDYLVRRSTMNSYKVAKLLKVLRLKVVPDESPANRPAASDDDGPF